MIRFYLKTIACLLILVVVINAVGIAQVSHICKMASALKTEQASGCCSDGNKDHCKDPVAEKDCCKNVVKFYHQEVPTIIQHPVKISSIVFYISLLNFSQRIPELLFVDSFNSYPDLPDEKGGRNILTDIQILNI